VALATKSRKTERIEIRATARQEAVLQQAASITDRTLSEFMLTSAMNEAQRLLSDQVVFASDPQAYAKFLELLDEPLESTEKLEKLWSQPSPFGRELKPR
jgi:uncharacterized protein (DUF1778 family)